jgi:UDP-2,3-diacylglucosamine pyrophosphatase LpxH
MKTLIISDIHLSSKFDGRKFGFLKKIVRNCDQVIIAGDFWDYYETSFESFINSDWKQLFPLLKSKNTIYLYGNHDREIVGNSKVNLFSTKQFLEYQLTAGEYRLLIEHGDKIYPSLEATHKTLFNHKFIVHLGYLSQLFGSKIFGESFFKVFMGQNNVIRDWAKSNLKNNEILVCGHTHLSEFNLADKFINIGIINYGLAQYLTVEDGKLVLHKERY